MVYARAAGDPSFELTPGEADALSSALGPVLTKYLPAASTAAGPEIALLAVLAVVMAPRLTREKPQTNDDPISTGTGDNGNTWADIATGPAQ